MLDIGGKSLDGDLLINSQVALDILSIPLALAFLNDTCLLHKVVVFFLLRLIVDLDVVLELVHGLDPPGLIRGEVLPRHLELIYYVFPRLYRKFFVKLRLLNGEMYQRVDRVSQRLLLKVLVLVDIILDAGPLRDHISHVFQPTLFGQFLQRLGIGRLNGDSFLHKGDHSSESFLRFTRLLLDHVNVVLLRRYCKGQ